MPAQNIVHGFPALVQHCNLREQQHIHITFRTVTILSHLCASERPNFLQSSRLSYMCKATIFKGSHCHLSRLLHVIQRLHKTDYNHSPKQIADSSNTLILPQDFLMYVQRSCLNTTTFIYHNNPCI